MGEYEVRRYIQELTDIENAIYYILESRYDEGKSSWMTLSQLSHALIDYHKHVLTLTINNIGIDGFQADSAVNYFCLEYYTKVQKGEELNIIEQQFPKREWQVAVAKHPTTGKYRVRRRLFKRLSERL